MHNSTTLLALFPFPPSSKMLSLPYPFRHQQIHENITSLLVSHAGYVIWFCPLLNVISCKHVTLVPITYFLVEFCERDASDLPVWDLLRIIPIIFKNNIIIVFNFISLESCLRFTLVSSCSQMHCITCHNSHHHDNCTLSGRDQRVMCSFISIFYSAELYLLKCAVLQKYVL